MDAMVKYAERVIKVRIPIESEEDPLKIFEEISRKFGRKLTMAEIEKTLEERYGPAPVYKPSRIMTNNFIIPHRPI